MSTCPEKDIHSIYVDNELPSAYSRNYENHIKTCPKCQKNLEKVQMLHAFFQKDASDHTVDDQFMEQSFNRLQSRLSYSRISNFAKPSPVFSAVKWVIPATAAAAALLFVFLPLRTKDVTPVENSTIQAITRSVLKPIAKNNVIVDGNLSRTTLASLFESKRKSNTENVVSAVPVTQAIPVSDRIPNEVLNTTLSSIDVFRPDFSDNNATISIKIVFPEISTISHENGTTFSNEYISGNNR